MTVGVILIMLLRSPLTLIIEQISIGARLSLLILKSFRHLFLPKYAEFDCKHLIFLIKLKLLVEPLPIDLLAQWPTLPKSSSCFL